LRMFGSYAWQHLTGLSYVTEKSDVDLLLDIATSAEWRDFLSQNIALPASPHIDLEIAFGGDASINWREYLGPTDDLLIKSNLRVWLERKNRLSSLLAT